MHYLGNKTIKSKTALLTRHSTCMHDFHVIPGAFMYAVNVMMFIHDEASRNNGHSIKP